MGANVSIDENSNSYIWEVSAVVKNSSILSWDIEVHRKVEDANPLRTISGYNY